MCMTIQGTNISGTKICKIFGDSTDNIAVLIHCKVHYRRTHVRVRSQPK